MKKSKGNVGRPREFDEGEVLSQVMGLFWEHGYEGTGLSDIMSATGLQKGSLYKAFGSKHGMYMRALSHYDGLVVDGAVRSLTSGAEPRERIYGFLNAPISAAWDNSDWRGCFLCNASADHAALDEDTRDLVMRGYGKLARGLKVPVSQMFPKWDEERAHHMGQLLLSVYTGLRVMARASIDRGMLEGARDTALAMLDNQE